MGLVVKVVGMADGRAGEYTIPPLTPQSELCSKGEQSDLNLLERRPVCVDHATKDNSQPCGGSLTTTTTTTATTNPVALTDPMYSEGDEERAGHQEGDGDLRLDGRPNEMVRIQHASK